MVVTSSLIFSDIVTIGERLEIGIKLGRIIDNPPNAIKVENPRLHKLEEEYLYVALSQHGWRYRPQILNG